MHPQALAVKSLNSNIGSTGGIGIMNARIFNISPETNLLSSRAFAKIQAFFQQQSGILIAEHKQQLIVTRLRSHMLSLGFKEFDSYATYLINTASPTERTHVVDLLTNLFLTPAPRYKESYTKHYETICIAQLTMFQDHDIISGRSL